MKQYYQSKELVFKTRWMTDEGFYFSEKELEDASLEAYLSESKTLEDDIIYIPFSQIKKVIPIAGNEPPLLDIEVFDAKAYQAIVADFETESQLEDAIKQIEIHSGLKERVEVIKNKAWIRNLLYTMASAFFGYSLVMMAKEIESGITLDVSGKRSGIKHVLASIAEQLGVLGCLILAIVIVSGFAYFTYTIYKSSNTKRNVWGK
ncbi:hypothetical protein KO02_14515 [Sphingobacterium sp. ML3W]|uniref:hypothetical protein n=1 Tax=Sphingobacterium sp. ML3W TaxID=1538644 RepID=UPI0004F590ED|nr:hypothetical protein [Sphingobacterium sp. ML3W]AIM37750.1 hypothetical protein KO02_14515 [Sphingobacterium sp. ML3W]